MTTDSALASTFVQARWCTKTSGRRIRVVVVHDMEAPEKATTAEDVARYFATTSTQASAHYNVDADSIVQCVREKDVAYAAPGANNDGVHIEHAGYSRQSHAEWLDPMGILDRSARLAADVCHRYGIPAVRISSADLIAGRRGICGHVDVTNAYHRSTHTDPGAGFPWDVWLPLVQRYLAGVTPPEARLTVAPDFAPPLQVCSQAFWPGPEGGVINLYPDGGTANTLGAPFLPGVNGTPAFAGRVAAHLDQPNDGEKAAGYRLVVVATSGERYGLKR